MNKYYIEDNLSIQEVANIMRVSYRTVQRAIKNFNLTKNQKQKSLTRKQTNLKKYGVENSYQRNEIKEKIKQTKLERYGSEVYNNSEKQKQTMLDIYNVKCGYNLPEVQNKIREKFGGMGWSSNKIKEKIKQTCQERYSSDWYITSDVAQEKRKTSSNIISKPNKLFADLLAKEGIETEFEFRYNKEYSFDLHILNTNILIEINPTYTHNSTIGAFFFGEEQKEPLDKNYHYNKCLSAINNGYQLISVFDWMNLDKVIDIIKAKTKKLNNRIFANKCKIKEISQKEANQFLDLYHIQGRTNHQTVCIGLYYNNELVQIQTFGKPRYNKLVEYEAIRLATKFDTYIIGGVSKGFNYFIKKYNPKSIISYNSLNISVGSTDSLQGFKFYRYSKSQGIFVNTLNNDNPEFIRYNTLINKGIDRILNKPSSNFPDYNGTYETSNEYLLIKEGYVKVYDCGNVSFIWENEEVVI